MVMTKEKVIRILKRELDISKNLNGNFNDFIKECNNPNPTYTIEEVHQALSMAIKVLEQDPILDKVRAEIEKEADTSNRLAGISEIGLRKALKIIDKYKEETENT